MPPYSFSNLPCSERLFLLHLNLSTLYCSVLFLMFFYICMFYRWPSSTVSLLNLLVSIPEVVSAYWTAFAGTMKKSPLTKVFSQLILNCKSLLCIKSYTTWVLCTVVSCNIYINYYITQITFKTSSIFLDTCEDAGETD